MLISIHTRAHTDTDTLIDISNSNNINNHLFTNTFIAVQFDVNNSTNTYFMNRTYLVKHMFHKTLTHTHTNKYTNTNR